jgi:type II secretory pathway pseudopilin PulG
MTLLEIMIVLAIIALVMGLVIGPKVLDHYQHSRREIATLAVHRLAEQDYPAWAIQHPAKSCPSAVTELTGTRMPDPWGSDYQLHCGASAPPELGFGASSMAEDRQPSTADDILSWRD